MQPTATDRKKATVAARTMGGHIGSGAAASAKGGPCDWIDRSHSNRSLFPHSTEENVCFLTGEIAKSDEYMPD